MQWILCSSGSDSAKHIRYRKQFALMDLQVLVQFQDKEKDCHGFNVIKVEGQGGEANNKLDISFDRLSEGFCKNASVRGFIFLLCSNLCHVFLKGLTSQEIHIN